MMTPEQYREMMSKGLKPKNEYTGALNPETKTEFESFEIPKPTEIKAYMDRFVVGQEEAKKQIATLLVSHMVLGRYNKDKTKKTEKINKSNILLIGNSGVGKTYMLKVASEMLKVPFIVEDATKLTQEGYVGDSVDTILTRLFIKSGQDLNKAQQGIVFIDEFDKISEKSGDKSNVSTGAVQQSLLKMIEGDSLHVATQLGKRDSPTVEIDTSSITFIFAGAFEGMAGSKEEGEKVGFFESENTEITEDNLIDFGILPEILGRIGTYISLKNLTEKELYTILVETEKSVIKEKQKLFELLGKEWTLNEKDYKAIIKKIKETKLGARGLLKEVERLTWEQLYKD